MRSPGRRPALAAGLFSVTAPTWGSRTGVPQPKARPQQSSQASTILAVGPAATTSRRCQAGRRAKLSSLLKPSGMSASSLSPTSAT